MSTSEITIGDISGILQLAQSFVQNLEITNFSSFIDGIRQQMQSLGALTPEVDASLTTAKQQLEAFPDALDTGQKTFVDYISDLVNKYPADTPLSEIPEFAGGTGGGTTGGTTGIDTGGLAYETDVGGYIKAFIEADHSAYSSHYDAATDTISISGPGYNSAVTGVQRLAFNDGILAFDVSGSSGQLYRLYQAAFDRDPDTSGISHNVALIDNGTINVAAMADAFVASEEFQKTYGALSNNDFIQQLYMNVLGRGADQAGLDGWLSYLNEAGHDRGDVLTGFAESQENHNLTDTEIYDGIWLV